MRKTEVVPFRLPDPHSSFKCHPLLISRPTNPLYRKLILAVSLKSRIPDPIILTQIMQVSGVSVAEATCSA